MKYYVLFSVDATVSIEVNAYTEAEAEELAWATIDSPRVCNHCSGKIDIGDIQRVVEVVAVRVKPA